MKKTWPLALFVLWGLVGSISGEEQAAPLASPVAVESVAPTVLDGTTDGAVGSGNTGARFWADAAYVLYWLKPVCLVPPTLSVGSPTAPAADGSGVTIIQGEHKFQFPGANGVRTRLGAWLTDDQFLGVEFEGFVLEQVAAGQGVTTNANSPATFIYFEKPDNSIATLPFSIPGVVNGTSSAVGTSRLWSLESNLATHFSAQRGDWLLNATLLTGVRYLELDDRVLVTNTQTLVSNPLATASGSANFATRNQFTGGQLGSRIGLTRGCLTLEFTPKIAVGVTNMTTIIAGSPLETGTSVLPGLIPGPLLAFPSNVGRSGTERITVVPEANIRLRWQVCDRVQLTFAYNALFWSKILCPGDQMDAHVNLSQLPQFGPQSGGASPKQIVVFTDEFAQGVEVGLGFNF